MKIDLDNRLREDSQAAGKWETQQGGEYYAAGVGSAITGRGANLLIIDDPHSEQDALNMQALERAYEWYTSGPRQRLQPGGSIVLVMTRWNTKDLTGALLNAQREAKADQWEVIEFPAILPSGKTCLARVLEARRIRSCKSFYWNSKMECAVYAKPNFRRRCHHQTRMVEGLGTRIYSKITSRHTILRHGIYEKGNSRLFLPLPLGVCFIKMKIQGHS
jgi:hypothetical protein